MADFNRIIEKTLLIEGGYSNRPTDRGGETNFGISKRQYPNLDIKNLTVDQARALYRKDYFDINSLGSISSNRIAWKVLDIGVNCGVETAARMLQKAVGVDVDGSVGPETIRATNTKDAETVMDELVRAQVSHYAAIVVQDPGELANLLGWVQRGFDRAPEHA